jgi:hypothetical protein
MLLRAVMIGASGAVGQQVVAALQAAPSLGKLRLLNRRPLAGVVGGSVEQQVVDVLDPFQPSMILTPTNRYGIAQGLALALWPKLDVLLRGSWRKYRGVAVQTLGAAIAGNLFTRGGGVERLSRHDFQALAAGDDVHAGGGRPARG